MNDPFFLKSKPSKEPVIFTTDYGDKYYWLNNQLHRLDGPAVEYADNSIKEYWFHGHFIDCTNQKDFERIINLISFW